MSSKRICVITGGIGSGKSVVSAILLTMGYEVYDTDAHAKLLMDDSDEIKTEISSKISPEVISADGKINRRALAQIVFSDPNKLNSLNRIVHGAVRDDIRAWLLSVKSDMAFVETAIPYQSEIDLMADELWEVTAPLELRIQRIMARNNLSRTQVSDRINAQLNYQPGREHPNVKLIINDGKAPLLTQIYNLLNDGTN